MNSIHFYFSDVFHFYFYKIDDLQYGKNTTFQTKPIISKHIEVTKSDSYHDQVKSKVTELLSEERGAEDIIDIEMIFYLKSKLEDYSNFYESVDDRDIGINVKFNEIIENQIKMEERE